MPITQLDQFADEFLEKCHVSEMICRYTVLHESDRILMALRPYQYYAVEKLIERVRNTKKNGYIWHTTGSGKTLTSFKAAQILTGMPDVDKVLFVVDRADLDYQTTKEFNAFSRGSVDGTDNTQTLVEQFGNDTRLIVTTIQKLNTAISRDHYRRIMQPLAGRKVVFIFDECHRSQFGETHRKITDFFTNCQMFGFTGTPIFAENAARNEFGMRTTKNLFGERLHRYVITDAIRDENVLRFAVEYWGRIKRKDGSLIDEKVAGIDTKEFFEHEERIERIVDWIIANHERKTHGRSFTAMLAVGSVDALIKFYDLFKAKKQAGGHDLRVATIFTYAANENDEDADGMIGEPDFNMEVPGHRHSREKLDEYIADYNGMFGTNYSTRDNLSFYNYYRDIGKRIKNRERDDSQDKDRVDVLLVVNMFLTGFDAKKVNTLYVDKNLRYHGLIQAFSRTNRILSEVKSHGNIVCFRNLKANTDEAVTLFSDKEPTEDILIDPYEVYVERFNDGVDLLLQIAPTVDSVNDLASEKDKLAFVKAFRNLIRLMNVLKTFAEFSWSDLKMDAQTFEDYKSKYLDIYEQTRPRPGEPPVSIIDEVDFELELIRRDEINVAYILELLAALYEAEKSLDPGAREEVERQRKTIADLLGSEAQLRSKRALIEKFISDQMPSIGAGESVQQHFRDFWSEEREAALAEMCEAEGLIEAELRKLIEEYHFTNKTPLRESVVSSLVEKPKILERKTIIERVTEKILAFVRVFDDGLGGI